MPKTPRFSPSRILDLNLFVLHRIEKTGYLHTGLADLPSWEQMPAHADPSSRRLQTRRPCASARRAVPTDSVSSCLSSIKVD